MKELLKTEMIYAFEILKQVKSCTDACEEDVSKYFKAFGNEFEECDCLSYEELSELPYFEDMDGLYYETDRHIRKEDREMWGEVWTFSDKNLTEYYKLLKELYNSGRMCKAEYKERKNEMEQYVADNILYNNDYYGIAYKIVHTKNGGRHDRINVYLDFNCGFSLFALYCGIIAVFDKYKTKLRELKETYYQTELAEAA